MRNYHQGGFAHFLLLVILAAGLIATVILINRTQIFKPRAAGEKQVILLEPKTDNLTVIGGTKLNAKTIEFQKPAASNCPSLQSQIDQAATGATLVAQPCLYRETVTINKPLILDGAGSAEIRGSDVWTEWDNKGNYWESQRQVANLTLYQTDFSQWCKDRQPVCLKVEQVFLNGRQLKRVIVNSGSQLQSGQFTVSNSGRILLADNPAGRLVEVSMRQRWINIQSSNVTVKNFVMRHASNEPQMGALNAEKFDTGINNTSIENNGIYQSHGTGIRIWGGGSGLINNDIGWHGQIGMAGGPYLIKGNFIHNNNTEGFQPGHEAGAFKVVGTSGGQWENNEVYSNKGFGMWCDIGCSNIVIKNNRIYDNEWPGIDYEVSKQADIHGNVVFRNALQAADWGNNVYKSGIIVNNARENRVYNNFLAWNRGGITINSTNNRCGQYAEANSVVENINNIVQNKIYNNTIIMPAGADGYSLGWVQQQDTAAAGNCLEYRGVLFKPESQNQGYSNQFWFGGGTGLFSWNNQTIRSSEDYNRNPGHANNILLSNTDKDNILAVNRIPAQNLSCQAQDNNYAGTAVLKFNTDSGGDFSLWSRTATTAEGIFWAQIDNDCPQQMSTQGNWGWVKTSNKQLASGQHTIKIRGQNGVKIDRFLVSLNSSCTPVNLGDNCLPPPLTTTLTLSKTSGFVSGETITLNFATTGGGNITIHTSIQEGITDPSQKRDCPSSCYQGFPSNTARKTARVPFYVEYLATDSQGNKEETKTMLVVAASTPPPVAVPADSLRGNCSNNQLSLTWQPFPGINRYLVRVDDTANDWGLPLRSGDFMDDNVTSTSYSNSNAKPGHTYRWWIHTIDNNGQFVRFNGVDSFTGPNVICSAAPASKPAVPAGLTSSCPAPGTTASLSWNPVAGADYYALRVNNSTTGGWNGSCTGSAGDFCSERETGNSKSFTSAAGNNYDWWIHACNSAGCGDGSPQAHFTCGSPTPARIPNPADLNNDGVVNAQDAQTIFELYGNSGSNNQQVTASDYVNILQNFGK